MSEKKKTTLLYGSILLNEYNARTHNTFLMLLRIGAIGGAFGYLCAVSSYQEWFPGAQNVAVVGAFLGFFLCVVAAFGIKHINIYEV